MDLSNEVNGSDLGLLSLLPIWKLNRDLIDIIEKGSIDLCNHVLWWRAFAVRNDGINLN
jgi:hypothetical protein